MVLGKLSVPGRPTYLGHSRARVGAVGTFFLSSSISLFVLPVSWRRSDIH